MRGKSPLALETNPITFTGRLGWYYYCNLNQAVIRGILCDVTCFVA